jgi:hypothetical protein
MYLIKYVVQGKIPEEWGGAQIIYKYIVIYAI